MFDGRGTPDWPMTGVIDHSEEIDEALTYRAIWRKAQSLINARFLVLSPQCLTG